MVYIYVTGYAVANSTVDSTIASSQIIEDLVLPVCAALSKRYHAIVDQPCLCHQFLVLPGSGAISHVPGQTHLVDIKNLRILVMKMIRHAHPVPSSLKSNACVAPARSRTSDAVKQLSHAVSHAASFWAVVSIGAKRCATLLASAKSVLRHVVNQSLSVVIPVRRSGKLALFHTHGIFVLIPFLLPGLSVTHPANARKPRLALSSSKLPAHAET